MTTFQARAQLTGAALGVLLASGCGRTLEEDLRISVAGEGRTVVVELGCAECVPAVDVDVYFDPDAYLAEDDEVVIEQYRVDYDLSGLTGRVPYFAGVLELHVRADEDGSFAATLAGTEQREHVLEQSPEDDVEGRATLTLAGYDSENEQAFIETEIPIRFVHGHGALEESTP
jgi:hypothetical protein